MAPGIIMGILAAFALIVLFHKCPDFLKRFAYKHPLLSEIVSIVFFFATITSITQSAAGVMAAFVAGAIWSIYFFVTKSNFE